MLKVHISKEITQINQFERFSMKNVGSVIKFVSVSCPQLIQTTDTTLQMSVEVGITANSGNTIVCNSLVNVGRTIERQRSAVEDLEVSKVLKINQVVNKGEDVRGYVKVSYMSPELIQKIVDDGQGVNLKIFIQFEQ
jgi:hypothetical protein